MDIFEAIERDDRAKALAMLTADPSLARALSGEGATPVLHAMYQHQFDLARALAGQIGADGGGLTLAEAAAIDDASRIAGLLAKGDPADGATPDGFTPLQLAAYFGAPGAAAALIAAGADVNAIADNPMRIQPLHAAAAGRHSDVAVALIAAGADIDSAQRHGWTPLHSAAHNGDVALVEALLEAKASRTATNDDGHTAAEVAEAAGHNEIVRLLG
jgi:ankyrin repeat protein